MFSPSSFFLLDPCSEIRNGEKSGIREKNLGSATLLKHQQFLPNNIVEVFEKNLVFITAVDICLRLEEGPQFTFKACVTNDMKELEN
jgi:hypothetical protein